MDVSMDADDDEHHGFLETTTDSRIDKLPAKQNCNGPRQYVRALLEGIMVLAIILLLVRLQSVSGRRDILHSPVPEFPRKLYTFVENKRYLHGAMFENNHTTLTTLHNWIDLSADARGYVQIPDRTLYDLGEPYTVRLDRHTDGPGYMMTVFHQLHCLSYLVEHFQLGYGGVALTDEVAHHTAHCFDYIRQGLMCAADTSLEGTTDAGPGWGSTHECKDYDAVLKWANEHGAMSWRTTLMPDDSTL